MQRMQKDLPVKQFALSANALKFMAIMAMLLDHFFAVFIPHDSLEGSLLRIPGRIVAPIMCFLIAEGYFYTSDVQKYIGRLFAFSIISHFPFVIYFDVTWWKTTSVFWGLTLGLVALTAAKENKLALWKKVLIISLCCLCALPANWDYIPVLWIVVFGIFRGQIAKQMFSFASLGVFLHGIRSIINSGWPHSYQFGVLLAIPLLMLYNGERGRESNFIKWGFYIFYPAHFILLYILKRIVFG